jgi:putative transposase
VTPIAADIRVVLVETSHPGNIGAVARAMKNMGLEGLAPKPRTTIPSKENRVYPYLLRGLEIAKPDHVWCSDITYIPMSQGYLYLCAVMDWYSRFVISWRLSNSLDTEFVLEALDEALEDGQIRRSLPQGIRVWSRKI